jgi:hypothetical protein
VTVVGLGLGLGLGPWMGIALAPGACKRAAENGATPVGDASGGVGVPAVSSVRAAVDAECAHGGAYACSADRASVLACNAGRWSIASTCRGEGGCSVDDGGKVACDDRVALVGDPCDTEGQLACSVDGKTELVCAANVFAKKRECRKSCAATEETVVCD